MKINGNNKKKLLREAYLFDSVNEVGCTRKVDYKIHHSLFFFSKCRHHNAKTKNKKTETRFAAPGNKQQQPHMPPTRAAPPYLLLHKGSTAIRDRLNFKDLSFFLRCL